jgi:L-lactate permease
MDTTEILNFIKKATPWIGAAATGNVPALVTMAAQAVGTALGTPVEPTSAAISAAVAGATPEQLLALKSADNELALKLREFGYKEAVELEQLSVQDRASARDREVKLADWTPRLIALLVVMAWIAIQAYLLMHVVDPSMRELVARLLGTLDAALMMVLTYYYGSNRGSDRKTELLAQSTPNPK